MKIRSIFIGSLMAATLCAPAVAEPNRERWTLVDNMATDAGDAGMRVTNAVILSSAESDLDAALVFYCRTFGPEPPVFELQIFGPDRIGVRGGIMAIVDNGVAQAAHRIDVTMRGRSDGIAATLAAQFPWNNRFSLSFFKEARSLSYRILPAVGVFGAAGMGQVRTDAQGSGTILDPALEGQTITFSAAGSADVLTELEQQCG